MNIRTFALVYGVVFLLVGIAGFIPALLAPYQPADSELAVTTSAGLLFGVWGLLAAKSIGASLTYARSVAVIYGVFVIMGLIPLLRTTFGLVPLHGHDVWLHLLLAAVAAWFGFAARPRTVE